MICPVCKSTMLENHELIENLNTLSCSQCQGNWIRFTDYMNWYDTSLEKPEANKQAESESGSYLPVLDSKQAKLCPDCSKILIKYKVDTRLDFYVDHCGTCNGVWLDKNEWELLKFYDLHKSMHNFFSDPWQKKLHNETVRDHLDKQYMNMFGASDYEKLKKVKVWIDTSERKSEILAFLMDENPYKL